MFKFATNKFNGGGGGVSGNSQQANSHSSRVDDGSSQHSNSAASRRRQIQKDLFAFNKIADKGFPSKPSAMDYDKKLKLLALGTKNGDIRIYGAPGTQQQQLSCYQDVHPFPIQRILFVQGQHQLITLSERVHRNDQTNKGESLLYLVLWQIPNEIKAQQSNLVEKIKEYQLDPKAINGTKLSAMTLLNDNSHLFLGFESGDVYVFNVSAFQLVPGVINKDYILKSTPESSQTNKKLNSLGAVESICHHPRQLTKLLLAYQRGLWVIFDFIKNQIDQINQTQQQLESAVFYQAGECVATAHSDGSFILWDLENNITSTATQPNLSPTTTVSIPSCSSNSAPNIVYGPYPCKPVQKCLVKTCRNDQPYVIFSGGCPRVNYSDKVTISVIQGENSHVCFDFTSKIIDYFTIDKPSMDKPNVTYDNPQALFVLLEEEFVAIDLMSEGWPQFTLPYLYSVHSSAIICTHYVNNVSKGFYENLVYYGSLTQDPNELLSTREWPVGDLNANNNSPASSGNNKGKDLLLTGHEDGTIRFWDVTKMSMTLIYKLKTSDYFQTESTPLDDDEHDTSTNNANSNVEDSWPPFRKVGTFDPYSDDPKLGIQKLYLCPLREILVIAGTAGQVIIMEINPEASEITCSSIVTQKINLIGVSPEVESHFVWKGHEPLPARSSNSSIKLNAGYQLHTLIQLYPPATISALTLSSDWQLVAMGTSHGFALFDYLQNRPLLIRCTLDPAMVLQSQNPNDSGGGNMISRRKSLKKSLRESFRKLRRGRSQKHPNNPRGNNNHATMLTRLNAIPNSSQMRVEHIADDDDLNMHKPIERQVESREFKPMDDIPPSVIRYMYFVRTFITSSQQQTNSLWVGTNTGIIYIYALQLQQQNASVNSKRTNQAVNCLLAKEMRLKHRAPVVHIQVIDQNMQPLPESINNKKTNTEQPQQTNHKVIICSEEQFKVFQLPTLKPVCKFKLTAVEGARVRRIAYNSYTSRRDPKYSEYCLSCLSNLGDLSVYSLPQLKRQVQIQCMKQQDINAITSFVFSKQGQAFYLQSPSEFVHISMSARDSPQLTAAPVTSTTTPVKATSRIASPKKQINQKPAQQQQQQKEPAQVTNTDNNALPRSPPPPVPTPRTTLPSTTTTSTSTTTTTKDEPNNSNNRPQTQQNTKNLKDSTESNNSRTEETRAAAESASEKNSACMNMKHSTPSAKNTISIDASPIKSMTNNDSKCGEADTHENEHEKISSMAIPKDTPTSEVINASSTTTSGVSLTSGFNQSSISSSTMSHAAIPTSNQSNLNSNNLSVITNAQSDSFNMSSSGYNGSSSYAGMSGTIDMSMDSVVDRFNEEFQDLSIRKIQPAINENDSLLNESNHPLDINDAANNKLKQTNGNKNATVAKKITNGHRHLKEEVDLIDSAPQKASSPLTKINSHTPIGPRVNKHEQVTKRIIENGNKPEYRETVID